MSDGFDEGTESNVGVGDAFYRAEGAIEGGVPAPRRRRRGNAGGLADLFGTGAVHGGEDAVFEGGIVAAGMDATSAMITSATMAQASHAMDALYQTREIAHEHGRGMFKDECIRAEFQAAEDSCRSNLIGPDGKRASDVEECVRHWIEHAPARSTTLGTQTEVSVTEGSTEGKGGKRGDSVKLGGDGKIIKGEVQTGGEYNWSDGENHGTGTRNAATGSTTVTTAERPSVVAHCHEEAKEQYRRVFPAGR